MTRDRAVSLLCLALAILLLWWAWTVEPPKRPDPPMATPVIIMLTATAPPVTAGPAVLHATQTTTVYTDRLPTKAPLVEQTPLTRLPAVTETPTPAPTSTRVPQTPVQKG